jgi:Acetyltransferase (GNAT) domain
MSLVIRPAHLERDQELLVDTLICHLNPLYDSVRFNWLYKNNPHGPARAWLMSDTTNSTVVGMAGAFPRRVYIGVREATCWVLGDFCIHEQYRILGPALQLQRACLADMHPETVAFSYDFPSASMLAVYKRLRIDPLGNICRFAKPLRIDRKIEELVRTPQLVSLMKWAGNLVLALQDHSQRDTGELTIVLHEGWCGEEFSVLAREVGWQYGVCVQRSAEYLNWRYVANPLVRCEILTARCHGVLVAYAVFTQSGEDAMVMDLFGVQDRQVISTLVESLIKFLRKRCVITLSAPLFESHQWRALFQRLGFRARETSPVVIHTPPDASPDGNSLQGMDWFLMYGDRDS